MIIKQPNGKYMRFSGVVDCPTHWNLSEEEMRKVLWEILSEDIKEKIDYQIKNALPIESAKDRFIPNNMTTRKFNKILKEVEE